MMRNNCIDDIDILSLVSIKDILADDLLGRLKERFGDETDIDKFTDGVDELVKWADRLGALRALIIKQGGLDKAVQLRLLDNFLGTGKGAFEDPLELSVAEVLECDVRYSPGNNKKYADKLMRAAASSKNGGSVSWFGFYDVPATAMVTGTLGTFNAKSAVYTCCVSGSCTAFGKFVVQDRYDFNYNRGAAIAALRAYLDDDVKAGPFDGRSVEGELKTVIVSRIVVLGLGNEFDITSKPVSFVQRPGDRFAALFDSE